MNRIQYQYEYLQPSLAATRTEDPAELLRVAEAWQSMGQAPVGLSSGDWERGGKHLDSGEIPLLVGGEGYHLRFEFPDSTTVLVDQRYYYRRDDRCSCGARKCRHTCAVLRALYENRFHRSWRSLPVLAAATDAATRKKPVVTGLVLGEDRSTVRWEPDGLVLRPSRRTAKGTWHRTLTWDAIQDGMAALPVAQQNVLRTLGHWRTGRTGGIRIEMLGPELWTLLDSARAAGLQIGTDDGMTLDEERIGADLHLEQTRGGSVLRGAPSWPGAVPHSWSLQGHPPHSILADHDGLRILHRLGDDPEAIALLKTSGAWIPETDLPEFTRATLPRLAARPAVHLVGALGAARTTAQLPPRLCATLTGLGADAVELRWGWEYGLPHQEGFAEHELAPQVGVGRRLEEELALLETLSEEIPDLSAWVSLDLLELDLPSACQFLLELRDVLDEHERALVRVIGQELELTAAGPPAIRWELSELADHDWLDLGGTLEVGGQLLSMGELIQALRSGQRYLVAGGEYVDLATEEMDQLRALLEAAAALPDEERIRISRHDLNTWDQLERLSGFEADAEQWRLLLRGIRPVDLSEEPLDPAVHATLRPYQMDGYRWLSARWDAGLGGILADDMGLGKTLQLLAAIRRHRRTDERPVLVAAPRSVLGTWAEQAAHFVPDVRVEVVASRLDRDLDPAEADVVVVSHQLLRLDSERYQRIAWAALILDEAQAAKNPSSQLHRALRAQHRDVTFVVTGTPVENSLQDLWALVALAAPGLLPPLQEVTRTWRRPIEKGEDPALLATLRRRIAPVLLRRTKDLVAQDLPPKLASTLSLNLLPAHVNRYTTALNKERQRVLGLLDDPERNRVEILAALTRLRLLATDPGTVKTPSAKVHELVERLEELAGSGHRALVFSQFTSHLRIVREILEDRGITTAYLDGSTTRRETVIDSFRTGDQQAFLISLKAGGSGLTLIEADYVFILDPWWNPAVEEQAIDRTHRIGQNRAVTVYRLVSAQTIEEKVLALQATKRQLISSIMDPESGVTSALDATQIRELIAG